MTVFENLEMFFLRKEALIYTCRFFLPPIEPRGSPGSSRKRGFYLGHFTAWPLIVPVICACGLHA